MVSPVQFRNFGTVPAGFPSPAQGYEDEPLDLHALMVPRPAATFFFTVADDGLPAEHLPGGTKLIVDKSLHPGFNSLVLTVQGGSFVVCRMPREPLDDFEVWGVVTGAVIRF